MNSCEKQFKICLLLLLNIKVTPDIQNIKFRQRFSMFSENEVRCTFTFRHYETKTNQGEDRDVFLFVKGRKVVCLVTDLRERGGMGQHSY